jgi:hypothetical protein
MAWQLDHPPIRPCEYEALAIPLNREAALMNQAMMMATERQ